MDVPQVHYDRERLAFQEKIALAKLEEAKAHERVLELEYQYHRFNLDFYLSAMAEKEESNGAAI
jgi:hypothetical protein